MTPERPPSGDRDLVDRFQAALVELQRKQEQLEAAVAGFDGADPPRAFHMAWDSGDAGERNRAEAVHAAFERSHQQLMDLIALASRLAERKDAISKLRKRETPADRLVRDGVISAADAAMIADHTAVRNEGQHAYANQLPREVWRAAERQLQDLPAIVRKVDVWFAGLM